MRSHTTATSSDTVRERVVVTVFDTITITKTITIRENEAGDTVRFTQMTDKTKATTRDRYHDVQEKVVVRTDTVYIERDSVAVKEIPHHLSTGSGTVRNEGGSLFGGGTTGRQGLIAGLTRNLKWLFFVLLAIIALIIIIRLKLFK